MRASGEQAQANSCDIGVVGLGVMGKNLALNLADHGYRVACFDLDAVSKKTSSIHTQTMVLEIQ